MTPEPATSVVMAASASRVRRKAIPGTGKAARSSEAICPPMMRTFWSAVIAVISASARSDSSSAYAVATSSTRRLISTMAPVALASRSWSTAESTSPPGDRRRSQAAISGSVYRRGICPLWMAIHGTWSGWSDPGACASSTVASADRTVAKPCSSRGGWVGDIGDHAARASPRGVEVSGKVSGHRRRDVAPLDARHVRTRPSWAARSTGRRPVGAQTARVPDTPP